MYYTALTFNVILTNFVWQMSLNEQWGEQDCGKTDLVELIFFKIWTKSSCNQLFALIVEKFTKLVLYNLSINFKKKLLEVK